MRIRWHHQTKRAPPGPAGFTGIRATVILEIELLLSIVDRFAAVDHSAWRSHVCRHVNKQQWESDMLRIQGRGPKLCDGLTRRDLMQVGALSLFPGLSMPAVLRATNAGNGPGAAKSVLLFNLLGGPSHIDMFDMKPAAPDKVRGEFSPISTSLAGLQICEHLPALARWMHKATLIRTITHTYNSHDPLAIMTGFTSGNAQLPAQPTDPPDIGAICQYLQRGPRDMPAAVCLPNYPGQGQNYRRGGPYGGFLGSQYDPLFSVCDPKFDKEPKANHYHPVLPIGEPQMPALDALPEMQADRFDRRRSILTQLDQQFEQARGGGAVQRLDHFQQRAFDMLCSSQTRDAFDLSQESAADRERYGRNLFGSSMLVARRLVERRVPFISVHQDIYKHYGHAYDMHANNFGMLKDFNLPILDQIIPALLQDLEDRGLLDSTLVIVMGEMGRTPQINGKAGRDHWPQCGFSLLFGGGTHRGLVHGTTDKQGAWPETHPVPVADFVATIYQLLGIDPHMTVADRGGRPIPVAQGGDPVFSVIA